MHSEDLARHISQGLCSAGVYFIFFSIKVSAFVFVFPMLFIPLWVSGIPDLKKFDIGYEPAILEGMKMWELKRFLVIFDVYGASEKMQF